MTEIRANGETYMLSEADKEGLTDREVANLTVKATAILSAIQHPHADHTDWGEFIMGNFLRGVLLGAIISPFVALLVILYKMLG